MRIGILGSGNVAQTLGNGFLSRGHEVMLGTRHREKLDAWKAVAGERAHTGTFADAAAFGEIVVLATLGIATVEAIASAGVERFAHKIVMDATNPLESDDRGPHLTVGFSDSLGEEIQRAIPQALVVKAFNTVGSPLMIDPKVKGGPPDMFIAGNDADAKDRIASIVRDFGWTPVDMGGIEASRLLEVMCMVWIKYGVATGNFGNAFKLLHSWGIGGPRS